MNIFSITLKSLLSKKRISTTKTENSFTSVSFTPASYTEQMNKARTELAKQITPTRDWDIIQIEAEEYLMAKKITNPTLKQCKKALKRVDKKPLYPDL